MIALPDAGAGGPAGVRPVLFLDIDGVLNSEAYWDRFPGRYLLFPEQAIDPDAVTILNEITDQSGAAIVVSSSWRAHFPFPELCGKLLNFGITGQIIDRTPAMSQVLDCRGREIGAWLARHPEVTRFVILDDDPNQGELLPYLVQTNWHVGLQREHIRPCLALLSGAEVRR